MNSKHIISLLLAAFCGGSSGFGQTTTEVDSSASIPTNGIVLNFHDVPLNTVLNYLSAKAGLIIVTDAALQGSVSVMAKQSITTNEIVDLLNGQLSKNNLTAILEGRTLRIMETDRAKTFASTPVKVATAPNQVGMTDEIVTEILPVNTLKPAQLVKDLESLIPRTATVTANDAGSVVIMTAPERDIHRVSEIIAALDSSAVSEMEVFVLKFADAKSVASELKEIFQTADSDVTRAGARNNFGGPGGSGGAGGPGFGFPGGGGENNENSAKNGQTHAVFISDDQMNAIVASAPSDYMRTVTNVIAELDKPSQDVTEIRFFRLKHADPTEVADELSNLFPSNNSNSDQNGRTMGFQFNPFQQQSSGNSSQSDRMKRQSTVLAVADRRSEAVIVTASRDSMPEIQRLIASLDEGNQGVTHVTAFHLASADAASVQETLAGLFQSQGSSASSSQTTSALSARMQANNNSQSSSATTTTSGFGSGSSGTSSSH